MLIIIIRENFSEIFDNKDEIKNRYNDKGSKGWVFPNFKIYLRGAVLTLFYLVISPMIISIISIILSLISPCLSILSFILILIMRVIIRIRRVGSSKKEGLTDVEKEFLEEIEKNIY